MSDHPQTTISIREARLERAMKRMIYETTYLSPEEDDGSVKLSISLGPQSRSSKKCADEK